MGFSPQCFGRVRGEVWHFLLDPFHRIPGVVETVLSHVNRRKRAPANGDHVLEVAPEIHLRGGGGGSRARGVRSVLLGVETGGETLFMSWRFRM